MRRWYVVNWNKGKSRRKKLRHYITIPIDNIYLFGPHDSKITACGLVVVPRRDWLFIYEYDYQYDYVSVCQHCVRILKSLKK